MVVLDKPNDRDSVQGLNDRKQRLRQRFQVVKKLGQGTYGKVQLAINKESKQEVAIKTIKKVKIENEQDMIRIRREIQIMSSIRHPHIIHIYEVFENHEKIVLITQYASGGELYDYLGCHKNLSENEARRIFRQVASAIFYCHKNKICHRDLKLENILLDEKGNAKIADFGLSNVFDEKNKLKTFCGSPLYASPEIVKGHPYCGPEVDCWSLGVLLYTLVYGAMPFDGSNFKRLVKQISEGDYHEPKNKSGASGLIRHLLTVNASCRANITDICNDWWVNLGFENSLLKVATDLASLTPVRQDLVISLSSMMLHAPQTQAQIRTRNYNKPRNKCDVEQQISGHATLETISKIDFLKQTASKTTPEQQDSIGNHPGSQNQYNEKFASIIQNFTNENKKCSSQEEGENELFTVVKTLMEDIVSKIEYNTSDTLIVQMCEKNNSNRVIPLNENMSGPDEHYIRNKKYTIELAPRENSTLELKSMNTEDQLEKRISNCLKSNVCSTFQNSHLPTSLEEANRSLLLENVIPIVENDSSVIPEKNIKNLHSPPLPARTDIETPITNKTNTNCLSDKTLNQSSKIEALAFVVPIFEVTSNIPQRRVIEKKTNLEVTKSFDECFSDHENKSNPQNRSVDKRFIVPLLNEENKCPMKILKDHKVVVETSLSKIHPLSNLNESGTLDAKIKPESNIKNTENKCIDELVQCNPPDIPPRKRNLVRVPKTLKLRKKTELSNDIHTLVVDKKANASTHTDNTIPCNTGQKSVHLPEAIIKPKPDSEELVETICIGGACDQSHISYKNSNSSLTDNKSKTLKIEDKSCCDKQNTNFATVDIENDISYKSDVYIETTALNEPYHNMMSKSNELLSTVDVREHLDILKENTFRLKQQNDHVTKDCNSIGNNFSRNSNEFNVPPLILNEMCLVQESSKSLLRKLGDDSVAYELEDSPDNKEGRSSTNESMRASRGKTKYAEPKTRTFERSNQRSLSRTRALSLEFESLAEMPRKATGPPKKPPGKVQIPKYFDPASMTLIKTPEKKEVIFIPTSTVSENKEKIERKIEQVKQSVLVTCPRRKSDVGITNKKKKYVRSQTDILLRNDTAGDSSFGDITDCADNLTESELSEAQEYANTLNNYETLSYCADHWHSVNSLNSETEECRKLLLPTEGCENIFKSQRKNDHKEKCAFSSHDIQHRYSVDTESGYWTPPEGSELKSNKMQIEAAEHNSQVNCNENIQSSRAAFKNSKLRMKLSDEGLDVHSLSSSIDSGIHSWKQEETNLKTFSPDSEIMDKAFILMKPSHTVSGSTYGPIVRSCKKIVFQPEKQEKLPTSKSPKEMEYAEGNNIARDISEKNKCSKCTDSGFQNNNTKFTKAIAQSDSQCSSGSYDALDEIFGNWVEKNVLSSPQGECETHISEQLHAEINSDERYNKNKRLKNIKPREFCSTYSTDKESSDNDDDDLDLMLDEYHPFLYGTDGLWQYLKSVDKNSKNSNKYLKPLCQRSKSQETKDPTHAHNQKNITRSLSKEEKEKTEETTLRHFTSEGKLHIKTNSDHLLDEWLFEEDKNVGNERNKSKCNLDDISRWEKQFMGSTSSLAIPKYSENISLYGTLHRSKQHQSLSSLNSPNTIRRKSLQCGTDSGEREGSGSACNLNTDSEIDFQDSFNIHKKLSLYGTLRTRNLASHNRAQSQVVLNTVDGYQILYNNRAKNTDISPGVTQFSKTLPSKALSNNLNTKNSNNKNTSHMKNDEFREMFKGTSAISETLSNTADSYEKYGKLENILPRLENTTVKRRVSFSNDTMNFRKTNYSSPLHLHSLNKLREAHEQLTNSTTPTYYSKDDDSSDGGSLLEALKAHGYKGLISQRLQNSHMTNETRLNTRISDNFDTDWPRVSNSDKLDYCLGQVLYQQPAQILSNPTENFEHYSLKQTLRMPVVEENNELKDIKSDILKQCALKGSNKNVQTYQYSNMIDSPTTARLTKYTNIYPVNDCSANRSEHDLEIMNIDDKNNDSLKTQLILETSEKNKINDNFSKLQKTEANNKNDESADTEKKFKTPAIKPETERELLSNKIKALQFRCQRKSLDEIKLQKELKNCIPLMEASQCSNNVLKDSTTEDYFSDRILDTLHDSTELGESVSDRIWRKSFYPRFNDASKIQRRKSAFFDYEISPDYKSFKRSGNSNLDESLQLRSILTHKGSYNRPFVQLRDKHDDVSSDINFLNYRNKEIVSAPGFPTTQHILNTERSASGDKMPLIDASEENLSRNIGLLDLENMSNMNNITELHTGKNERTQNIPQIHGSITVECATVSNLSECKEDRCVKSAKDDSLVVAREHEYETPLGNQNQTSSNTDSTNMEIMDKNHDVNET